MVRQPKDYRWSSHSGNAYGKNDPRLTPHEQYLQVGRWDPARRESYRALFKAHLDEPLVDQIRQATNGNHALGNARFQEEIEAVLGRRARRGDPGRPRRSATWGDS